MKRFLNLSVVLLVFLVFSCSSSKSQNDSDVIADSDCHTDSDDLTLIEDDDSGTQDSEIVDDSDDVSDFDDSDSDETPSCEEEDEEECDDTDRINGYKRCYDEIPDEPYEGFFANPKIEYWVKDSLGYDRDYELKEEDLEKVTEMGLPFKDIRGIEKLVNLESVTFFNTGGNVYDFTPLSKLKKLKTLRISFSSPEEINPNEEFINMTCLDGSFSLLTNLEFVRINYTELKDVSPVEQLVNLKSLDLAYNKIEFLPKNIGNLQKLESLNFMKNKVKDITVLKLLTNLKGLFFHYNYVKDISPIADLVNLNSLGGDDNGIKDISPITNLLNLTYLRLDMNQIEKLPEKIGNLKKLKEIQLEFNKISSIPSLNGLESIKKLDLSHNELDDKALQQLANLEKLVFLYAAVNKKITKVPIMKNLKSLQELYLNYNSITDLSGFADNESFPALKRLDVGSNKIDNVEAFRNRKGLSTLWVDKNCIKDFSPLEELKAQGTHVGGMNEQLESCEDK